MPGATLPDRGLASDSGGNRRCDIVFGTDIDLAAGVTAHVPRPILPGHRIYHTGHHTIPTWNLAPTTISDEDFIIDIIVDSGKSF